MKFITILLFMTLNVSSFANEDKYVRETTPEQRKALFEYKERLKKASPDEKKEMIKNVKTNKALRKKLGLKEIPLTSEQKQARKEFNQLYQNASREERNKMKSEFKEPALKDKYGLD